MKYFVAPMIAVALSLTLASCAGTNEDVEPEGPTIASIVKECGLEESNYTPMDGGASGEFVADPAEGYTKVKTACLMDGFGVSEAKLKTITPKEPIQGDGFTVTYNGSGWFIVEAD